MIPKYNYNDIVSFSVIDEWGFEEVLTGKVYIIDRNGTFGQHEEVSYDIMVDNYNKDGASCLFKHIVESRLFVPESV